MNERPFQPVIQEDFKEELTHQLSKLKDTYEDLVLSVENLGLTEDQYKIFETITCKLYSQIDDLEGKIYFT